jgi:hypothetical protein
MSQGQALLLAVGGLAAWALIFVVWWMLVGYGTSIAVRTYRWAMRHHQPAAAVGSSRRAKTVNLPAGGLNSYASQRNNR